MSYVIEDKKIIKQAVLLFQIFGCKMLLQPFNFTIYVHLGLCECEGINGDVNLCSCIKNGRNIGLFMYIKSVHSNYKSSDNIKLNRIKNT